MVESEVLTPEGFKLYFHKAHKKKYKPTVVFIHHMWGSHRTTGRHYRYLNDKGFDCVSFDLLLGSSKINYLDYHPLYLYLYKGVFYVWTRQIRSILNFIDGQKILYGFSGPALSTFWAAHGRDDIVKIICDGGPFHKIYQNSRNMFYHEKGIANPLLNSTLSALGTASWGYQPLKKLHKILSNWNTQVPILSIRGVEDPIVKIDSIDQVFRPHKNLPLEILELRHGKHLDGLRDFPDEYGKSLLPFIDKNLTKLGDSAIVPPPRPKT